jgi:phosphatidylserine/phosphatidylglycerophosphate/cardiolipin synthase-like enzyme
MHILKSLNVKYIAIFMAGAGMMLATNAIIQAQSNFQFRVVYSLDARRNDQEIVRLINNADKYAYFAVYYFTEKDIAEALIRAKDRGVDVRGITDRDAAADSNKTIVDMLQAAGIPVEVQKHMDGIMHMKVLVTDKAYASGSYNWTESATDANDEVLEIGTDRGVHGQYLSVIKRVLQVNQ